ncbi:alpha/beta hydrolase [uncultured Paraglaciecola sp.]|uniref:alpha/beta fold hydrolase n=1 Tax=uncultured Paraglaciecola sp. TaxID=1765024 RepID=UPI0030D95DAA|tara:strand:- start:17226 stop:18248 length:1023 start_codon:yes stop_codon:yes gene_type:complete
MLGFRKVTILLGTILLTSNIAAQQPETNVLTTYDAELSHYVYSNQVKFYDLQSQGKTLKLAYSFLPGKANKPVVTLLHGKNFIADYWATTASFLQKLGYGVLMVDQIGFGKSSKPTDYQYSFAVLASHTKSLLDSLNIKNTIVLGHSMGGMLASRFALMYPNSTMQLILLNPIGLENYLQFVEYKDTDFFYQSELKKTAQGVKNYQQTFYYDGQWNEQYAALTDFMIGQINGPDKALIAWVNAKTYDMIFTQPVVTEFTQLSMPVSLILGTRDRTGPGRNWQKQGNEYELGRYDKLGKKVLSIIPNGALYEMQGLGHLPHIEDFTRFTQVLTQALEQTSL